jgi:hypothetical protein
MATAPSPNDLTRQQLDELDALLQRMLSVPLNGPEPVPTPPAGATGWRTDSPAAVAAPPPHLAPPPLPTIPPNPFIAAIPAPETAQYLPLADPEPEREEALPSPVLPPPEPARPVVERRPPPAPPAPVVVPPPPKPAPPPPPAPVVVRAPVTPRPQPETPPVRPQPPAPQPRPAPAPDLLGAYAESSHAPEPVPFFLWPLVGFNWLVDSILGLFGPPGRLLRSGFGKYLLGLTGIGLLLYTAAHLVTESGWLSLPFPIPWPE